MKILNKESNESKEEKIKILFRAWFFIAHSYSLVNCFQIIHLFKNYSDKIDFYIEEMPYFREEWNSSRKLVYKEEYNQIIRNFKKWNGEEIDLIYSITYPYNMDMTVVNGKKIPKCVFYTSEFATLDPGFFSCTQTNLVSDNVIKEFVKNNKELWMTSPSVWSSLGMEKYNLEKDKNRIITHGVDSTVFYKNNDFSRRQNIRNFYKVKEHEILLMNIGAMTQNKGMFLILQTLNILVNHLGKTHYKLLLKGTGDLYNSKTFLEIYFSELMKAGVLDKARMDNLLTNHIIFTDKTLSYEKINDLFNAADLYLSPYIAEGFNLTSLEALSAGTPVIVPITGSTKEYMEDIFNNGGEKFIYYVNSKVIDVGNDRKQNDIQIQDLLNCIVNNEKEIKSWSFRENSYSTMKKYITEKYSWNHVSDLLYNYFEYIVKGN
jgi:glycosyltransferase involved in cell wall biosynthesis